jgi:hypothetical protein
MDPTNIKEIQEIKKLVEKNPAILRSLHPLEKLVVEKLCKKGLGRKA